MMIRTLLTAAAAAALLAGAAHAGEGAKKKTDTTAAASTMQSGEPATSADAAGMPASDTTMGAMASDPSLNTSGDTAVNPPSDSSAMAAPSASSTGADSSAVVSTTTTTNGPVADTPENRAKYKPLSNAGKRSAAKGN